MGSQFALDDILPTVSAQRKQDHLVKRIDYLEVRNVIVGWIYVMDNGVQLTQRAAGPGSFTGLTVVRPGDAMRNTTRVRCKSR